MFLNLKVGNYMKTGDVLVEVTEIAQDGKPLIKAIGYKKLPKKVKIEPIKLSIDMMLGLGFKRVDNTSIFAKNNYEVKVVSEHTGMKFIHVESGKILSKVNNLQNDYKRVTKQLLIFTNEA